MQRYITNIMPRRDTTKGNTWENVIVQNINIEFFFKIYTILIVLFCTFHFSDYILRYFGLPVSLSTLKNVALFLLLTSLHQCRSGYITTPVWCTNKQGNVTSTLPRPPLTSPAGDAKYPLGVHRPRVWLHTVKNDPPEMYNIC